jgi:threonine synthase
MLHDMTSRINPDAALPPRGLWRFRARFVGDPRVATAHALDLGEGDTPLVPLTRWGATLGLRRVWAKLEGSNPTGSYKDRGMAVLASVAAASGATHLVEDSSGNAGAAAAAYAARGGMTCTVFAPASAPAAKLRQIRAYGAELVAVPGPRSAVADAARAAGSVAGAYHVSHNDNPLFVVGNQSIAFELAEAARALGTGGHPWHVVMPVGGGALYMGAAEGFASATIGDAPPPRLHGAQTTSCAPLATAYATGSADPAVVTRVETVCGGIEIERPPRGRAILAAAKASGGSIVASDDSVILDARDALARMEGVYAEPTSCAGAAALIRLARAGTVAPDNLVVLVLTGTGLKDPGPLDT